MTIDATERAELEQLRLAARLSGTSVWSWDVAGGDLAKAKATFIQLGDAHRHAPDEEPPTFEELLSFAVVPDDRDRLRSEVQAYLDGNTEQFECEYRIHHKDGSVHWNLARGVATRDAEGRPIQFTGTSVDVTRLKQAEEESRILRQNIKTAEGEARRAGAQVRLATELSGVSAWSFDVASADLSSAKGTFGGGWERLGYRHDETPDELGPTVAKAIVPEDQARLLAGAQACLDGTTPQFECEYRVRDKDGAIGWRLGRGVMIRDDDDRPISFTGTSVDITQLKHAQEELHRVRERLELAVSGSKACTWDFELEGGDFGNAKVAFNNYWELLGYDGPPAGAESLGAIIDHAVAPEDRLSLATDLQAFLAQGEPEWEREGLMMHRDGTVRWQLSRGVVARDAAGAVTRFTGASIDITDRKLTEKALQDSEERFRRTFENAAVGMILIDIRGRFLEYNARFCEFLGYSREELAGHKFVEFMIPDEVEHDLAQLQRLVRGEITSFTRDKRYLRKDGAIVWGNITVSVIQRHADGTPVHVMGILQDITERKTLEDEIEKAQARMQLAMRGSDVAVFDGEIPGGDPTASKWTHFNMWEPMGFDAATAPTDFEGVIARTVHAEDMVRALATFEAAIQARSTDLYLEHRVSRRDGSVLWRLTRGTFVYDEAGTLTRLIGTSTDITKLKQIEGELQRAREAAESANRAKDEFLANVSHEIRTPMNAILGMTELALDAAASDHQRQLLSTVRSAAKNLLTIINDLLDFSKIASGKLTLDRADFSLRAAVGDTLRALAVRAHRKGLELLCRVHPDVPDALEGDAGRLRQVLMNLVGNAIKFTQRGEVEVDVEAEPSSGPCVSMIFTIRDTGIGIAREKQAAIFRAFEQEDSSTTRKYGGTGLGLTISAQLASLMGGNITVQSAPGCGSTFRFTARFARSARPDSTSASPERLAALRVLVVDDSEPNRRLLLEWLTSWRMQPRAASDATEATAALASAHAAGAPFSLVLLDARMPDIDGVALAAEIRQRWGTAGPRLILLSSEDSADLAALARENGVLAYLLKPVQQSELLEAIWAVMNLEPSVPASAGPAGGQPEHSRPLRVLVAEDNDLNVTLLKELLRQRGHVAQFAHDGRAALELALRGDIDLMLLDLHMPELDGFEVVQAIRDHERGTGQHLRIIALTARSSARDRERCLAAGMDEFLAKPIEAGALWAAMDRLVAEWPLAALSPRAVEPGLLDARAILRACGRQPAVLEKLRLVFRRTLPGQMQRIRAALAGDDLEELREAAHQIVGTVGAFSTVTAGVASTLEDAAIRQDRDSCAALVERLGSLCDALLEATETLSIDSLSL